MDKDNTELLTDKQVNYAISQLVYLAHSGPYGGMVALAKHFAASAEAGRATEARRDADKLTSALAKQFGKKRAAFEKDRRRQFFKNMKLDTGSSE